MSNTLSGGDGYMGPIRDRAAMTKRAIAEILDAEGGPKWIDEDAREGASSFVALMRANHDEDSED